ncbi:MAG: VWA domain-containing protein [Planctomycetes bacterium]|nr:VWA domain-containing protein [Planctomycetota bacterium]
MMFRSLLAFPLRSPNDDDGAPPRDALDGLLREWHDRHGAVASANRDRLLDAVRKDARLRPSFVPRWVRPLSIAASLGLMVVLGLLFTTAIDRPAYADGVVMMPEAGRLDALAPNGQLIGPCPLRHTDVQASVVGPFARVTLLQQYQNTYPTKIEAVYTFPLSHRGAVDRMTMTIVQPDGERVVVGEVRERSIARAMYEAAREQGYVASLLEQERPNIFTQSVANIEPGARVDIEISYVETLVAKDGRYAFEYPTVVGPRYIPGPAPSPGMMPPGCTPRLGVVLLAPVTAAAADGEVPAWMPPLAQLPEALAAALPIATPEAMIKRDAASTCGFMVTYGNGSQERCMVFDDGTGWVNGRWFCLPNARPGAPFAQPTTQVPDADRITPMPVLPGTRAGHDLGISLSIDAGGIPITSLRSALHVVRDQAVTESRRVVTLAKQAELPNRDFIVEWSLKDDAILEATASHWSTRTAPTGMGTSFDPASVPAAIEGGYLTLVVSPPAAIAPTEIPARELVFVLDTSGSMRGFPIDKAKQVMSKAIAAMRPADTFNVITFAGSTRVLWPQPVPATPANIQSAQAFVDGQQGGGGTEMMQAINAALVQRAGGGLTPAELIDLPADGREVHVLVPYTAIVDQGGRLQIQASPTVAFPFTSPVELPSVLKPEGVTLSMRGRWATVGGERVLEVREAGFAPMAATSPMRLCIFLTDGYVGNDRGIVAAVRANAGTTRVFSFGIGNSVNRWLLDEMARAGRGESEFVTLEASADEAVERLTRRIQTPVLADVSVSFEGFEATATTPALIPDLFDAKPIVAHARYLKPGSGTVIVRGRTGGGPWERRIPVQLVGPGSGNASDMLPSLWARSQVDDALAPVLKELEQGAVPADVRRRVTSLGEGWQVMTPFTSFIAIEKARVTIGGRALLVPVPIELPQGTRFDGFFGEWCGGPVPMVGRMRGGLLGSGGDDQDMSLGFAAEAAQNAQGVSVAPPVPASAAPAPSAAADPKAAPAPMVASSAPPVGVVEARKESASRGLRRGSGDAGRAGTGHPGGGGGGSQGQGAAGGFGGDSKGKMESMASRPAKPGAPAEVQQPERKGQSAGGGMPPAGTAADRAGRNEADSLERSTGRGIDAKRDAAVDATRDAPTRARDGSNDGEPPAEPAAPVAPAEDPVIVLHDVRDLVGLGAEPAVVAQATERLVRELQRFTGRELWTDQGGRSAAWSAQDGLLRIEAWPSLQRMIDGALRTRRAAMGATGGIDRDLVRADEGAAITAMRARVARPLTTVELARAWDLLGTDLIRAALLGTPPAGTLGTMEDGSVWVSISVTENNALGRLASGLVEPGINAAARVVVGRVQPVRLVELVQDPGVAAVNTIPAP